MITVIVYTLNDEQTIQKCLDSIVGQQCTIDFETVVIDDGSQDKTIEIVRTCFSELKLFHESKTIGWVASLRKYLPEFKGDTLAFLGAHCQARPDWITDIEEAMKKKHEVVTGMGYHKPWLFLDRFFAITIHGSYLGLTPREVGFIWDDNFAVRKKLLKMSLPKTDSVLSDGAGAALVSLELQRMGIAVMYCPLIRIDHVTHALGALIEIWSGELAENAVNIKLADPSLPGARFLWLGPLMAAVLTVSRFRQDVSAILEARHSVSSSPLDTAKFFCLSGCLMPFYFWGLCRQLYLSRKHIRQLLRDGHDTGKS